MIFREQSPLLLEEAMRGGGYKIRQFTIYYAGPLGRWAKRIVDQAADVPSIIFFSSFLAKYVAKSLSIHVIIFFIKLQK